MDDEYVPDEPDEGPDESRTDGPGRRRSVDWLAGGILLLAVLIVGTLMVVNRQTAPPPRALPSPSPSASAHPDPLDEFLVAVSVALPRVVPGADGDIQATTHPRRIYVAYGQVRAHGRHGGLRVTLSPADGPLSCTGRGANCHLSTGSDGAFRRVESFDVVLPGEPRSLQLRATVARPDNWWVEVNTDNADAPPVIDLPAQYVSTGQAPPLTADEVVALASDPSLNVCTRAPVDCATS